MYGKGLREIMERYRTIRNPFRYGGSRHCYTVEFAVEGEDVL
jgi:hypothetical protein